MIDPEQEAAVRELEARSVRAWPAHEEVELDGWLLRFAGGYTRRSNSVNPLRRGDMAVPEKVGLCEAQYRQRGLPAVFKMTEAAEEGLDALLERNGYAVAPGRASVQSMEIAAAAIEPAGEGRMRSFDGADGQWVAAYARMNGVSEAQAGHLRRIVSAVAWPCAFLLALDAGGEAVGCGLCVVREAEAWLFDIAVDPAHRRRGHGRRVVAGLLAFAREQGAGRACLQVLVDNLPARRLYEGFGFVEHHQYWYRARP